MQHVENTVQTTLARLLIMGSSIVLVGLVGWLTTTLLSPASDSEPPALEQVQE